MKKYLLGFAAIVMAIAFSAFTDKPESKGKRNASAELFIYVGPGGQYDKYSYEYKPGQEQECENSTSSLCEVWAVPENPSAQEPDRIPILEGAEFLFRD